MGCDESNSYHGMILGLLRAETDGGAEMIVLITGASHTGKTVLAQKLLEQYHFPYLSIDHLKMGLIRSGYTTLTPESEEIGRAHV